MTPDQIAQVKTFVMADQTAAALATAADDVGLAAWLNEPSATVVWKTMVPVQDVFDSILWANMTPSASPDDTNLWQNRNLQCQSKQLGLQTILMGREQINASKANIRAGLQDALTMLPSKADGSTQNAGYTSVLALMKRPATRAESVLATGTGTDAVPALLVWEGNVDYGLASTIRS